MKKWMVSCFLSFVISGVAFGQVEIHTDRIDSSSILGGATLFLEDSTNEAKRVQASDGSQLQVLKSTLDRLNRGTLSHIVGYKGGKIWILFSLLNRTDQNDFVLRYSYPSMQKIEFMAYDPSGALISKLHSGKLVPFGQRPVKDTDYLFPLKLEKNKVATIAMSFESTGSMQIPLELMTSNRIHEYTQNKYLLFGLYYGVIFLILLYSLFLSLTLRGPLYISYFFYILSVVFSQMGLHGISYRYLWPNLHEWNRISTIFFVGLMFCSLSIFSIIALELKQKARLAFHFLLGFALCAGTVSFLSLLVYGSPLIKITGIITSLLPIIIIPPGIVAWLRGHQFAPYYLMAVLFYLIGASLYGLKDSGFLPPNFITENGILLGSFIEISIFSLGIAKQIQQFQLQSEVLKLELERSNIMSQVASQVSHDIRSPLSALNLVTGHLPQISEEKRIIIRSAVNRINDIANQLLQKSKDMKTPTSTAEKPLKQNLWTWLTALLRQQPWKKSKQPSCSPGLNENAVQISSSTRDDLSIHLLSPLIDSIVSEKRIQFREKNTVKIEVDLSQGYGLFAKINPIELKRVISNLINNSIEAFLDSTGTVVVAIRSYKEQASLIIQDTGKGIPNHILQRLGETGVTYGKEGPLSGTGLGISHAKKTIQDAGGKFEIQSKIGEGTSITMTLARAQAPKWFTEKLILTPNMTIVSLDDDLSIHHIWQGRFEIPSIAKLGIELRTFTSGIEFRNWFRSRTLPSKSDFKSNLKSDLKSDFQSHLQSQCHDDLQTDQQSNSGETVKPNPLYLIDYEMLDQKVTGLDLIEELGIGQQAILVTSRFEEEEIRARCERLGVKLIPKALAGYVPIEMTKAKEFVDGILLDDDSLVHSSWQLDAESKQKKFVGFYNSEDFFHRASEFDRSSNIYVDSNLGHGVKGEILSRQIQALGFTNIYLCTGYEAAEFQSIPSLKGIVGKDPQF